MFVLNLEFVDVFKFYFINFKCYYYMNIVYMIMCQNLIIYNIYKFLCMLVYLIFLIFYICEFRLFD